MATVKFKVGDKVRRYQGGSNDKMEEGDTGVVYQVDTDGSTYIKLDKINYKSKGHHPDNIELISSNNSIMNLIEQAKLAFKGEPEKSFIKAGVLDSNENLTADGQQLFLTYLLKKHGEDFKTTVIDPIIKEQEAK